MAWILNIETATPVCSVSLARDGELIEIRESREDKSHARLLTRFVREVLDAQNLEASGLDAVAVSKGPGSYTGLRIGVSTAKGIAYGAGIHLIGINSLQALSQGVMLELAGVLTKDQSEECLFCPMIDARRMEVYMALYTPSNQEVKKTSAVILRHDTLEAYLDKNIILVFGNGAAKCMEVIDHPRIKFLEGKESSSKNMIGLSERAFREKDFEDVAYFEPFYLKDFIATIPKNKVIRKNN